MKMLVIGGGFFGMYISEYFALQGHDVALIEKENDFMQRASYVNQARVHNGYHYPRSILTALRSRMSFPKFYNEFRDCINDNFDKYYMISSLQSKVSAKQFEKFCHRIGAICEKDHSKMTKLINHNYIEAVFNTKEFAFDSEKLKNIMLDRVKNAGVKCFLNEKVMSVTKVKKELLIKKVSSIDNKELDTLAVDEVFNCAYCGINQIVTDSSLDLIPLKHQLTEIALVTVPDELKNTGITVMDGPFFSVMPFPAKKLHSFSHVRYTPHYEWYDQYKNNYQDAHNIFEKITKKTSYKYMVQDAKKYLPILSECKYEDSIWEIKTILPSSENNDSRPILFKHNYGLNGFHNIMGGKIDNIYDIIEVIKNRMN